MKTTGCSHMHAQVVWRVELAIPGPRAALLWCPNCGAITQRVDGKTFSWGRPDPNWEPPPSAPGVRPEDAMFLGGMGCPSGPPPDRGP